MPFGRFGLDLFCSVTCWPGRPFFHLCFSSKDCNFFFGVSNAIRNFTVPAAQLNFTFLRAHALRNNVYNFRSCTILTFCRLKMYFRDHRTSKTGRSSSLAFIAPSRVQSCFLSCTAKTQHTTPLFIYI